MSSLAHPAVFDGREAFDRSGQRQIEVPTNREQLFSRPVN